MHNPLVSVCMITYNHEKYIRDAIEGVLIQKTNFPIELIIGEDCSTDNTRKIVKEYEAKYPEIIIAQYPEINRGMMNNFATVLQSVRGKYIALCEGDDYWIDPYKLQKQVDFLEENPDYGLVHADCHFYYEDMGKWEYNANKNLSNSIKFASKKELFYCLVDSECKIRTATALFRRDLLKKRPADAKSFSMGDTTMWLDFSQLAKFKYFDEVFAVYRILSNSASRSNNKKNQYRFNLSMAEMRIYYCNKYNYTINNKLKDRYNKALLTNLLFDSSFQPLYPLFEPHAFQQFRFKYSRYSLFNIFFLIIWIFSRFTNVLIKKIEQL